MLCKRSDSQKNTMSLHYVQSESLTSGVTVSVRCDGISEKFQLSFYNQTVSTGDGSATLSFKAMHCCESCCHRGSGTMQCERQVV